MQACTVHYAVDVKPAEECRPVVTLSEADRKRCRKRDEPLAPSLDELVARGTTAPIRR